MPRTSICRVPTPCARCAGRAGYAQTLGVLAFAKHHAPQTLTKTSLMLGLGESDAELESTFDAIRAAGVDVLTLGQYLRPTAHHLPVARYVSPDQFAAYRGSALARGFVEVVAGPLVRSSYRAERLLERNNVGMSTMTASTTRSADATASPRMTRGSHP